MSINFWIEQHLADEVPKSKSLIVTVFGDSLMPLTDGIWLGDLISLMAPFGVSERLVRTSCFRLIDEGWLGARRDGRRSHYSLTSSGQRRIELAYQRVYTPPQQVWDGEWTLVVTPKNGDTLPGRVELRRELEWEGFALLTPGVLIHPVEKAEALQQILDDLALRDRVAVLRARALEGFGGSGGDLLAQCWNLDEVGDRYRRFIAGFEPLLARLTKTSLKPQQAFVIQTLMIHAFRRATLHDPRLPLAMLPADWPGVAAYTLCRELYGRTSGGTRSHVETVCALPAGAGSGTITAERFRSL